MSGEKRILKKITSVFELPSEITLNLPVISLVGSSEISIENYRGIIEYSDERIRLNTSCGVIKIMGQSLSLKQITSENITVAGKITGFMYL